MIPANKKIRMTRQRQIILDELRKVTSHPTADEIYSMVREKLPNISLGTVYRNLEILTSNGFIQKLDLNDPRKHYDGNAKNHYHIRCIKCGRVDDIHEISVIDFEDDYKHIQDYEVVGHHLDFEGICPECKISGKV